MFNVHTHKPTQYPDAFRADITVDEMTPESIDAAPVEGRTIYLAGWVSSYNLNQILKLLDVGDTVVTAHPTTAANLTSIATWDSLCHHLEVHAFAGEVHVQRIY
jgi:hypothetical protein